MPYLPYHRVNFKKSLGQFQIQSKQAFWAQNGVKITYLRPQGISSKKQLCTESFPNVFNLKYWAATLFSKHHYIPTVEKSMRKVVDRQTYKHTCRQRQHNNKLKTLKSVNLKQQTQQTITCSKFAIETLEHFYGILVVSFKHISYLVLVFLMLTLSK